jgi:hypothetical protein
MIPQCFKSASVIPLYKGKGSQRQAKSYRPIALLISYCNIFERCLFSRLNNRIESQLIPEQHGFRKDRSCMSALRIFTDYLYISIDKRKGKAAAIFVDPKKAFDSFDQSLLIQKLMTEYEIEPWYVRIINEVFRNRVFRVGNDYKYYCMPRGVCQGSALGPLLFSMYINSVGSCFSSPFLLYADDLVLYDNGIDETAIINKLLIQLDKLCDWFELNSVFL